MYWRWQRFQRAQSSQAREGQGRRRPQGWSSVHTPGAQRGAGQKGAWGQPAVRAEVPRLDRLSRGDTSRSKRKLWMGAELTVAAGKFREEKHPEGTGREAKCARTSGFRTS